MRITSRQLRRLIQEAYAATPGGVEASRVWQRSRVMDPDFVEHLSDVGSDDPAAAYELAKSLGSEEQPLSQELNSDTYVHALLTSKNPTLLAKLGFENLLRSIEFDKKSYIAKSLVPEKLERAEQKAKILDKAEGELMEIRYSWWSTAFQFDTILEWLKNNPHLYESEKLKNPYPNTEYVLYTIKTGDGDDTKDVKMLHISSAEFPSTITI
mgnify:CR=1 FL=1